MRSHRVIWSLLHKACRKPNWRESTGAPGVVPPSNRTSYKKTHGLLTIGPMYVLMALVNDNNV